MNNNYICASLPDKGIKIFRFVFLSFWCVCTSVPVFKEEKIRKDVYVVLLCASNAIRNKLFLISCCCFFLFFFTFCDFLLQIFGYASFTDSLYVYGMSTEDPDRRFQPK